MSTTLTLTEKYSHADSIAASISTLPAFADFSSKTKEQQYWLLFNQTFSGKTITERYGETDGSHIVGLVRHRLNTPAPTDIELELP